LTTRRRHRDSQAEERGIPAARAQEGPETGKRRNLGTFKTREEAEAHERVVPFFKRCG